MAIKKDKVDAVLVGFGWTGAIMGQELTEAGLQVLALERGAMQDTPKDAEYPKVLDELAYSVRGKLFQDLSRRRSRYAMASTTWPCRTASMARSCWAPAWAARAFTGTACTFACCPRSWNCARTTRRATASRSFRKA